MCKDCGCSDNAGRRVIEVQKKVLESNEVMAKRTRERLAGEGVLAVNLMSSPGAGKTTLIEKSIECLGDAAGIGVIEGDLETERDAARIRARGVPVHQVSTGQTCHLDAFMVDDALKHLPLEGLSLLFIENVGNLVCPASYDVGAHINVVLLSTTEGDDKAAKYPLIFRVSDLLLITKTDLLPYISYDFDLVQKDARIINPDIGIMKVSSEGGDGMGEWIAYLKERLARN